jgi:hypothetical protein
MHRSVVRKQDTARAPSFRALCERVGQHEPYWIRLTGAETQGLEAGS